jgi:hypothetical protein
MYDTVTKLVSDVKLKNSMEVVCNFQFARIA